MALGHESVKLKNRNTEEVVGGSQECEDTSCSSSPKTVWPQARLLTFLGLSCL
jgi:hypothetical protein